VNWHLEGTRARVSNADRFGGSFFDNQG